MKKLTFLIAIACFIFTHLTSQNIELSFTAIDSADWVQLDSIKVMNRTQGGDTVLHWPDTALVVYYVGLPENTVSNNGFEILNAYPNPVKDYTTITLFVPEKERINFFVTDLLGRTLLRSDRVLDKGKHAFKFIPGEGSLFFITAQWRNQSSSTKIMQTGHSSGGIGSLQYIGNDGSYGGLKTTPSVQSFYFNPGDELLYIGYYDTLQSGMLDTPEISQDYIFQFAYDIPCPGTPTVEYEGQTYNTVQIMSQCWLKENLNVGKFINAPQQPTDNDTIEKYCLGNIEDYCDMVGGLYFWNELMKYTNQTGGQGICPEGWHIPTDLEWMILEGVADSEFPIGDGEWMTSNWRGFDAGGHLKQTGNELWEPPNTGAKDSYGFTALPGGYFVQGDFWGAGYKGIFWSSDYPGKYFRQMDWEQQMIKRQGGGVSLAISVRCVKD